MRSAARTSAMIVAMAGVVTLAAAGCGGGTPTASESGSAPPSSAPPSATATGATPSPSGTGATGAAGPDRCHTGGLAVSARALGAAAGNHYAVVTLTNTTRATCRVYGYPGMQLLTAAGQRLPTTVVRDKSSAPVLVSLAPNAAAFTELHWGAVEGQGDDNTSPCTHPPAKSEVTPPDETANKVISWTFGAVCERGTITVTSMRAGTGPAQ
jgi:hypothetical protein